MIILSKESAAVLQTHLLQVGLVCVMKRHFQVPIHLHIPITSSKISVNVTTYRNSNSNAHAVSAIVAPSLVLNGTSLLLQ